MNICSICFLLGHKDEQCYGQYNNCLNWGHNPKSCSKNIKKIEVNKARIDPSNSQISLSCKICELSTKKTKASKSKQKLAAHMNSKHPSCDEDSSTSSQPSTCKRSPAKVSDISRMLPNSSSSDVPSSLKSNRYPHIAKKYPQR